MSQPTDGNTDQPTQMVSGEALGHFPTAAYVEFCLDHDIFRVRHDKEGNSIECTVMGQDGVFGRGYADGDWSIKGSCDINVSENADFFDSSTLGRIEDLVKSLGDSLEDASLTSIEVRCRSLRVLFPKKNDEKLQFCACKYFFRFVCPYRLGRSYLMCQAEAFADLCIRCSPTSVAGNDQNSDMPISSTGSVAETRKTS